MSTPRSSNRKAEILDALAVMLEKSPGQRITTAALAAQVGVTEAALYRHFPSKARMFEGLLDLMEQELQHEFRVIFQTHKQAEARIQLMLEALLQFAGRRPGLCRLLTSEALQGEQERLRERVTLLLDSLEKQLKQCLRERKLGTGKRHGDEAAVANLLLAFIEGRLHQYVRSGFKEAPHLSFASQWPALKAALFAQD